MMRARTTAAMAGALLGRMLAPLKRRWSKKLQSGTEVNDR